MQVKIEDFLRTDSDGYYYAAYYISDTKTREQLLSNPSVLSEDLGGNKLNNQKIFSSLTIEIDSLSDHLQIRAVLNRIQSDIGSKGFNQKVDPKFKWLLDALIGEG